MTRHAVLAALVAFALLHCGGDSYDEAPGNESGPCFANGTCNPGLSCASDRCVRIGGDAATGGTDGANGSDGGNGGGDSGGVDPCALPTSAPPIRCGTGAVECPAGKSCCVDENVCGNSSLCTGTAIECVSDANCGNGEVCCAEASIADTGTCPPKVVNVDGTACRSSCASSEIQLCLSQKSCASGTCVGATLVAKAGATPLEIATGACR